MLSFSLSVSGAILWALFCIVSYTTTAENVALLRRYWDVYGQYVKYLTVKVLSIFLGDPPSLKIVVIVGCKSESTNLIHRIKYMLLITNKVRVKIKFQFIFCILNWTTKVMPLPVPVQASKAEDHFWCFTAWNLTASPPFAPLRPATPILLSWLLSRPPHRVN